MNRYALTRRELLAGSLGLPMLWSAGCGEKPVRGIEGEIVGASDGIGHRIREGYRPRPPENGWRDAAVVIVGGGIAGLAAARRLKIAGVDDCVLFELEPAIGGTSREGKLNAIPCPWGAHYLPVPLQSNRALIELLEEIGIVEGKDADGEPIVSEFFLCRDPEERLFSGGTWREGLLPELNDDDQRQMKVFQAEVDRWVEWRDANGRRAFTIPVATCSDDPEATQLDRQTMAAWLNERNLNSPRLRWIVDYGCRDDYGLTVEQTSAWAGLFYFASRVRKPGNESQPFITAPEGNGLLVRYLGQKVREQIRSGMAVTEIGQETGDDSTIEVIAAGPADQVEGCRARHVIFAAPQFLAPYLINGYRDARGKEAAEFQYGSWMVANLHLKSRLIERGFPLAWDNVLYDSPSLGYVVATHQIGSDHGKTVFTYYLPLCDDDPKAARERLLQQGWSDWVEFALNDLERAHPDLRSLVDRIDIMRWGHAMIRPRPGFIWGTARAAAAQPFGKVYFAHSDLSGVALFEEAFYHGNRAAEEVLAAMKIPFQSIL